MKKLALLLVLPLLLISGLFAPIFNPGGGGGGGSNHNILSSTHSDTTAAAGVQGDLLRFNTTWERLGIGTNGQCLTSNGTLPVWGSCAAGTAPTGATYITQTHDATLIAEQALGDLATGIVKNTTTTGVLSIAAAGTDYVAPGGALGTPSSGTLTNTTGLPISTGVSGLAAGVATFLGSPSSANLFTALTSKSGSGGQAVFSSGPSISAPSIDSAVFTTKINPPSLTAFPGSPSTGDTVVITDDSAIGACDSAAGTAITLCRYNGTSWVKLGDGGGGGGSSSVGSSGAVQTANGSGAFLDSGCTASASTMTCTGGFIGAGAGTGVLVLAEGTAPAAPSVVGDTNLFFDSSDHKLKSQVNGGSIVTYGRTVDNLSVFANTTSVQLASVLSDETGSGAAVFGTTPTLTTPVISGAISFPAGVAQTFVPNGTTPGLNIGSFAGDPSTPNNGDTWYNSTTGKFRFREGGTSKDVISTGAGSGDVTDVNAGAGIAVATPGGPAPTVSWDSSTFVNNVTMWDGANASRTMTFNLSGTDPVITFGSSSIDVTTGTLKQSGTAVSTASTTDTLTNKSYDAEGTGNVLTVPKRIWLPMAGCNNATAAPIWDLPASNAGVAACVTGTNTQKGVMDFADGSNLSAQITWKLPSTWSGNVDANFKWFSATTTGDVVWQIATICVGDGATDDPAFNTASKVTDTTKGTTNQTNDASITSVTVTGCSAGQLIHIKVFRDSGDAADNMAGTARLIGVELVVREAI